MPATIDEIHALRAEFERTHRRPARALSELPLLCNVFLEDHQMREGSLGNAFERFVVDALATKASMWASLPPR